MPDEDDNPYAVSEANLNLRPEWVDTSTELASIGSRFVASVVDSIILIVTVTVVTRLMGPALSRVVTMSPLNQLAVGFALFYGTYIVINGFTLQTRGQTLGKMMMGIRIVNAKDGELPGLPKILALREVLQLLIPFTFALAGVLYCLVDVCFALNADRRCLHDLIAGTKVVKVTPR